MLPRAKSIFHLGEEGYDSHANGRKGAIRDLHTLKGAKEGAQGLQIIIHHKDESEKTNVVIKPFRPISRPCQLFNKSSPQLSFLKTCFLCKKELSPHKDVYMYRGDQGFCSEECRCHQISVDERSEFELLTRLQRSKIVPHHHHHHRRHNRSSMVYESDRRRRRILAVT